MNSVELYTRDQIGDAIFSNKEGMDLEKKLGELRRKLHDYEIKAKQIPHLKKEIAELEEAFESHIFHNPKGESRADKVLPDAPMPAMKVLSAPLEGEEAKNRLRSIHKKLEQITKLKLKCQLNILSGDQLDEDGIAKINSEPSLLEEMACIKNGESFDPDAEAAAVFKALPSDPAEAAKRTKALRKKLQQIGALKIKAKGGGLGAEEQQKLDSERQLKQELEALEKGATTVEFVEPSLDEVLEKQLAEKTELEKKMRAVKKKLTQITTLKTSNQVTLDDDAKAKLATKKNLQKELSKLEQSIGDIDKRERARVEARLG